MSHENPLTKSSIPPPFFSYFTCSLPHQILSSETLENSPQPSSSQSKPPEVIFESLMLLILFFNVHLSESLLSSECL